MIFFDWKVSFFYYVGELFGDVFGVIRDDDELFVEGMYEFSCVKECVMVGHEGVV